MKSPIHELKKQSTRFLSRTIRTFFLVAAVILPSLLITSCVPPPVGGGTPSPTNLFTVDLSLAGKYPVLSSYEAANGTEKAIVIDGDSIIFAISKYYSNTPGMTYAYFRAYFSLPNQDYELLFNNEIGSQSGFPYNSSISNSTIPTNSTWIPLSANEGLVTGLGYSSGGMSFSLINIEGLPLNEYRYWVFRKPKNGSFLYFWVKVIGVPDLLPTPNNVTIKIENGRYQMDNIITGQ